jgi:ATP-dependent Clp protease ATP-binding subunit ClpX
MGKKSIGFVQPGSEDGPSREQQTADLLRHLEPEDLVRFGLIPEFIGRLPVAAVLDPLDEKALTEILTEPRDALVKQYQKLMHMDSVHLEFKNDAIEAIAREAYRRKTGARALRGIVEAIMLDVMYELPSRQDVTQCTITREMVEKRSSADVLMHPSSLPTPESA